MEEKISEKVIIDIDRYNNLIEAQTALNIMIESLSLDYSDELTIRKEIVISALQSVKPIKVNNKYNELLRKQKEDEANES